MMMDASSAIPYGTCLGSSSSRITGFTNRTLATLSLERRRGGVPAARQVVGVQTGQGERLRQVARDADARGEADHAARRADDVEGRRVMRAERVAHHPVARALAVHLVQKIHGARDLPLLPLAGERVQPDVLGAVAADLHAVLHHAAELVEVHVELARDDARVDADVFIEELADDVATDARRQPFLEHALHERHVRPVEAGGGGMGRVECTRYSAQSSASVKPRWRACTTSNFSDTLHKRRWYFFLLTAIAASLFFVSRL